MDEDDDEFVDDVLLTDKANASVTKTHQINPATDRFSYSCCW